MRNIDISTSMRRSLFFVLLCLSKLTKSQSTVPTAAVPQQTQAGVVIVLASEITADLSWNPPQLFGSDVCGNGNGCAGSWWVQTAPQAKSGSIHGTVGENTSVELSFNGTSVSVFGRTLNDGANGLASVDGGIAVGFPTQSPDGQFHEQQLLWSSPTLDGSVEHVLKVAFDPNFFGATVNNRSWLQVDYFQYTFNPNALLALGSTGSSSATPTASSSSSTKHSVPIGAIAGGVAGGVALVVAGAFVYCCCKRRSKENVPGPSPWHNDTHDEPASQSIPVPFVMSTSSSSAPISSHQPAIRLPIRVKGLPCPHETVSSQVQASRAPPTPVTSPETTMLSLSTRGTDDVVSPPAYSEST
ncbi:hypothetical protein BU17DRAFT_69283 [Hysterangium stoloniferum]|nr:hypothetical protein BU17DRAFT_69283 [Hysterangium stoloniferum]